MMFPEFSSYKKKVAMQEYYCIKCKRDGNKEKLWYTEQGAYEYYSSALCQYCFDEITRLNKRS